MAIASKALFHLTGDYETLCKILTMGGFWPRYCVEVGWGDNQDIQWAVPMVCFTDIPMKHIQEHMDWYGNYGLGMSRKWAIANGRICPVLYLNKMSKSVINAIAKRSRNSGQICMADYEIFSLIKNYEGKTKKNHDKLEKKILYEEREWRYIPILPKERRFYRVETHSVPNWEDLNNSTIEYKASFHASDIDYIILNYESERVRLMNDLDTIFGTLSPNELLALKSKIITREYIEQNF